MKKLFVLFFIVFICCFSSCEKESKLHFICEKDSFPLIAQNKNAISAKISRPEKSSYAFFSFSDEQKMAIQNLAKLWKVVSYEVDLALPEKSSSVSSISYGLIYNSDFDSNGKLKDILIARPMVEGQIDVDDPIIKIALTLPQEKTIDVCGFFIYSSNPLNIVSANISAGKTGFDISKSIPAYYFGENGGIIPSSRINSFADFSSNETLFSTSLKNLKPVISILLTDLTQPYNTSKEQYMHRVKVKVGSEEIFIRRFLRQNSVTLHCAGLENPFSIVEEKSETDNVNGILMHYVNTNPSSNGNIVEPLNTDPGMIPLWKKSKWRSLDYELFQWEQFPGLLFFDTIDYDVQNDFFRRLAFFTEKTGYIGTLVSDSELEGKHGFNAHDYKAETLASFFTLAIQTDFPLNAKEILLAEILSANKIIIPEINQGKIVGYKPGYGGVISISQESPLYLRYSFIVHEGLHGLYFIDSDFRDKVKTVFNTMDKKSLNFLLRFFQIQSSLNYNLEDTYLIQNEFMAYVMQQSVVNTESYFAKNLACRGTMIRGEPELSSYVRETNGIHFVQSSQLLSDYVFSRWGLESGRIALVSR